MKKIILTLAFALILLLPTGLAEEDDKSKTIREWAITEFRPGFEADTASYWLTGISAVAILIFSIFSWKRMRPKKRKPIFWLKVLWWMVAAGIIVFILYSVYNYWYEDISVVGLETCDEEGCRISMHWHAEIEEMTVCGEKVERPWETGDLSGPHTHKNTEIHLHTILDTDPATKEITETYPITLGGFFDAIGWEFNVTCFKDTCNTCNGVSAATMVWVNGEEAFDFRNYAWKDGDSVLIEFS